MNLLPQASLGVRQRSSQFNPLLEMSYSLEICRPFQGPLPGLQPVGDGLFHQASGRVVVRQRLGLGLGNLAELRLELGRDAWREFAAAGS